MATNAGERNVLQRIIVDWIRVIAIILVSTVAVNSNGRCGCAQNRPIGNGFYTPELSAVRGDPYQAMNDGLQHIQNYEARGQRLPSYKLLQFQPTYLDFRHQYVGMPVMQMVAIVNPSNKNQLRIVSIRTGSPHFHASLVKTSTIEPLANTTFELVFLPRLAGNVENTVFIRTNKGEFTYQVFGVGMPNVYRLRAFIGATIPVDGTFSPYINMYNPYSEAIQVTEMYSSGGELHLDLPTGSNDVSQKIWEIPPFETKAIMKATFYGKTEGNHTGFVRIKTTRSSSKKEEIILPFDVDVSSAPGLYTNIDTFDFGTLRTMDEPKSLNLNMINTGNRSVPISAVISTPPNKAISIQFTPMVLKPSKKHHRIAVITFTALHVSKVKQQSGTIVIQTGEKNGGRKEIAYSANVLQGTLAYSVAKTAFFSGSSQEENAMIKPLTITNTFNFSLIIYNATIPVEFNHIFAIENFVNPTVVSPGKLVSPLSIKYLNNQSDLVLSTTLRLYTNASIFTIPVHSYTGKLKHVVEGQDEYAIDYGTVGASENRTITFRIINTNPVEVSIKEYSCCGNVEFARLRLDFVRQGRKGKPAKRSRWTSDRNNATRNNYNSTDNDQITLRPKEEAVFSIDVAAPAKEGAYRGEVTFKTAFEEVHIPLFVKVVIGNLVSKPKRIHFENSFPGQTKSHTIYLESTFSNSLKISDIKLHPPDNFFTYLQTENEIKELLPNRRTKIGSVRLDPLRGSESQCYLCLCQPSDSGCNDWVNSLSLPADTWELDLKLLEKNKGKWEALKESKQTRINTTLVIDSEVIRNHTVPIQASLSWPTLVEQSVRFPPTHIDNYTEQELTLTNPADVPVLVQVLPLMIYPHPNGAMDLVSDRLEEDPFSIELNGHSAFSLSGVSENSPERLELQSIFGVTPSPDTISLLLKRRSKAVVKIGFKPEDEKLKTSLMVVRNNLTILELVVVQGQGARGQLTINEKKPGLESLLLFELKAGHLNDCNKSTARARTFPSFTVKRTFTATNVGQLPINVMSVNINGYECSGYGFRILDCEPFTLLPNKSKKLDITFTPDFTTSRLTRTLRIVTSVNTVLEFTLLATLPHHLLSLCASSLPRPFWEPYFHMVTAFVMTVVFIFVIFGAYVDAQKYVLQCTFGAANSGTVKVGRVSEIYTPGNVFNLNSISSMKSRTSDKKDSPDGGLSLQKSNGLHLPLQKKGSNDITPVGYTRSRSSSTTSSTSEISLKSTTSTPSFEAPREFRIEPERKETESETKKTKSRHHGSNESIGHLEEKPKSESIRQGRHRRSEKEARNRRGNNEVHERRPYEEVPASNIVIKEVSILDTENERALLAKSRKKAKSSTRKESKEQKKQQQQPPSVSARPPVKDTQPGMKLCDFELAQQHLPDNAFTKVESKAHKLLRKGNKVEPAPEPVYRGSLDRLDEISISGPRPDARDSTKGSKNESKSKQDSSKRSDVGQKRKLQQPAHQLISQGSKVIYDANGKIHSDTPTSPHAIAAAVVEAALERNSSSKAKRGKSKLEKTMSAGSTPASLESLSDLSRSSSYSSIVSSDNPMLKFLVGKRGQSPPVHRQNTPSPLPRDDSQGSSGNSSPVNFQTVTSSDSESWSSYICRLAVGTHPGAGKEVKPQQKEKPVLPSPTAASQNTSSMFFYDNLSSLRATKKTPEEDLEHLKKAPGAKIWSQKDKQPKSELDPSSKEFIPKSQLKAPVKLPFRNRPEPSSSWHESRKSGRINPPPGLNKIADIWGFDNTSTRESNQTRESSWNSFKDDPLKSDLGTKLRNRAYPSDRYSLLMPQQDSEKPRHSELFDNLYNAFGHSSPTDSIQNPWSADTSLTDIDQQNNQWATPGIRPSIWSNSRSYSAEDSQISRSLLGLDLSVPPHTTTAAKQRAPDRSPVSPFSPIWDASDDSIDPYEGWSEDIKEG